MNIIELSANTLRQYIDSRTLFEELERVSAEAKSIRGNMRWRVRGGKEYLVRVASSGGETGLGVRSPETEAIHENFMHRKSTLSERLASLRQEMQQCVRRNMVEGVGHAPEMLVKVLARLAKAEIAEHFVVIGTHALYAYEQAAGLRIQDTGALATKDVDLLWDTRKRLQLATQMKLLSSSMIGLLQDVDASFRLKEGDRYKAINATGFEVDILRREARHGDPHPLQITDCEEDFWVVQAQRANDLLSGGRFSAVVASARGEMVRMTTVAPALFVEFKRWMAAQDSREPEKRARDLAQANIVAALSRDYFTTS